MMLRVFSLGGPAVILLTLFQTIVMQDVDLTSTLDEYNAACPGEKVTFICVSRQSNLMQWTSPTFLGDTRSIQFSTDIHDIGYGVVKESPYGQNTFAQLIDKNNDTITSELRVIVPDDADVTSIEATCIKEDIPRQTNTSSYPVARTVGQAKMLQPVFLYDDPDTGTSYLNISWDPVQDVDVNRYEVMVDGLKKDTLDVSIIMPVKNNISDIHIVVTIVDRCNRYTSTTITIPQQLPSTTALPPANEGSVTAYYVYAYIALGFVNCFTAIVLISVIMLLNKCKDQKYSWKLLIAWSIAIVLFSLISLGLLINVAVIQSENASTLYDRIFFSYLLFTILVGVENLFIVYAVYKGTEPAADSEEPEDQTNSDNTPGYLGSAALGAIAGYALKSLMNTNNDK